MILKPQLGFTYDCPKCLEPVSANLDIFALCSQQLSVSCSCDTGSELTAHIDDNVLHVKYPCALCGQTHEASFLPERPLSGEMCCLECPQSGLPTGYISTPEKIAILDSPVNDEMVCRFIMELLGVDRDAEKQTGNEDFTLVQCKCGCRSFSASYQEPYLRITCQKCGEVTEIYSKHLGGLKEDPERH